MQRIHFIAIGGAIMHQLAIALSKKGNIITGSDDEIEDPAKSNLKALGLLPPANGWFPDRVHAGLDAVVLGMHARKDNPELLRAQALGIPVYSFPQYVHDLSVSKNRIVVAGSHGKTTITSMIMHVLRSLGKDFDYLVGARVQGFDGSVKLSDAPVIVLEGDEYPASPVEPRPKIFFYDPNISVLSGIAWDHINVFPTYENYLSQFETYLRGMKAGAQLFYNGEDSEVKMLVQKAAGHLACTEYRMPAFHYEEGEAVLDTDQGPVRISVFGWHNVLNMEAARLVCAQLGISNSEFYAAIADFGGAARRLERLFERGNVLAFRDFAHAPSKLKATISGVKEAMPHRRIIGVFELHTFSSLNENFLAQYEGAMQAADNAFVFYSQHALELKGLPALSTEKVEAHFAQEGLKAFDNRDVLIEAVRKCVEDAGDSPICLLLMSSGTFEGLDWEASLFPAKV